MSSRLNGAWGCCQKTLEFSSYRQPWWPRKFLYSQICFFQKMDGWFSSSVHKQCVKMILFSELYCTPDLIGHQLLLQSTLIEFWLFYFFFLIGWLQKTQVHTTGGSDLQVCLQHILRHNYPLLTCLNRRSAFTCSATGHESILEIEIQGNLIQVASTESQNVLICKLPQETFLCWFSSIQTLGEFIV